MPMLSRHLPPGGGLHKNVNRGPGIKDSKASTDPKPTSAGSSWKDTHKTAADWELQPDTADSTGSDEEGPSRGHITATRFDGKGNDKVRKQSPTEDSDNSSNAKRRKTSTERANRIMKGASRTRSPASPKKNLSYAEDAHQVIFGDLKVPKTYSKGDARGKAKFGNGARSTFSNSTSSQGATKRRDNSSPDCLDTDGSKRKSTSRSAPQSSKDKSTFENPFETLSSPPKSKTKPRGRERMEHLPDDDDIPSPEPLAKFERHDTPRKDKYKREDEYVSFSSSTEEEKAKPKRKGKNKKEQQREPTPPPPTQFIDFNDDVDFKDDIGLADLNDTQIGSGFLDPTDILPDEEEDEHVQPQPDRETPCPWCAKPVLAETLTSFSKGNRLTVRQQQKFCRSHNKATARDIYAAKSYPTIHWDTLPSRIEAHAPSLLPIINNTTPSHYRSRLAEKVAAGTDRAMKSDENLHPGYYGPRGFNMMCEILVQKWGSLLKEVAVKDRVISGRGSAYFIQSVLVAELAMRLVSEDMGVGLEEARRVLEESKEIGEMLNEDD